MADQRSSALSESVAAAATTPSATMTGARAIRRRGVVDRDGAGPGRRARRTATIAPARATGTDRYRRLNGAPAATATPATIAPIIAPPLNAACSWVRKWP